MKAPVDYKHLGAWTGNEIRVPEEGSSFAETVEPTKSTSRQKKAPAARVAQQPHRREGAVVTAVSSLSRRLAFAPVRDGRQLSPIVPAQNAADSHLAHSGEFRSRLLPRSLSMIIAAFVTNIVHTTVVSRRSVISCTLFDIFANLSFHEYSVHFFFPSAFGFSLLFAGRSSKFQLLPRRSPLCFRQLVCVNSSFLRMI